MQQLQTLIADGRITAAVASQISDASVSLLLASEQAVEEERGESGEAALTGTGKNAVKKRKKRALPDGEAKSPKGRTRLVKHAVRQRR